MKKGFRITLWILVALLLLLLAGVVAIQSPKVQTALARRAVSSFTGKMDGDIHVGSVAVKPFDALVLQDVVVTDRHPYSDGTFAPQDTLLKVGSLSAKFSLRGLLHKERVSVSRLRLKDGVFNLVIEPGKIHESRINLLRVLGIPETDKEPSGEDFGDLLEAGRVDIENMTFRMVNYIGAEKSRTEGRPEIPGSVIDWNDLEINTDIHARNLLVKDGEISGDMESMRISDKTGLRLEDVSGKVRVGHEKVLIDNLHVKDWDSDLHLRYFRMLGSLSDDYSDFLRKVRLEADILPGSVFSMQTVSHFAPNLEQFTFQSDLTGKVEGTIDDFKVKGLTFREKASGVSGLVNGSMTGLPDINNTVLDFKVKDLRFDLDGLGTSIGEWAPDAQLDLSKLGKGTDFGLDATVHGTLNQLAVNGDLDSNAGKADIDLTLRNLIDRRRDISIGGILETHSLDVGRIAGIDAVGPVSLKTGMEAVLAPGRLQARIDSLDISSLNALGYEYTGIAAVGMYEDDAFDGRIVCDDPNLSFLVQGKFDLSPKKRNAAYQFYANVGYADLNALNIDKRGPSKVSFQADANFIRTKDRDLLGEVNLRDVMLENAAGHHRVGDITASAHTNDDIHRIRLQSNFADGSFVGQKSLITLVSDLRELLVQKELPSLLSQPGKPWEGTPYDVNFKFHDAQSVLGFILPGLYVEKNTALNLKVSEDGLVTGSATSGRIALGGKYLKDFRLDLDNRDGALHAGITGSAVRLGGIELLDNHLTLSANDDRFAVNYHFNNGTETENKADVRIEGGLSRDEDGLQLRASALPSAIYYDGNRWDLQSGDVVLEGSGDLQVDRFRLLSKDQTLTVHGGISKERTDTLTVRMDRFDISLLNSLLMEGKMDLKGRATGRANLVSPTKPSLGLLAGITCDSTYIAGRPMGQLQLGSVWNEEEEGFNLRVRNRLNGKQNIGLTGFLRPKDKAIRAEAVLDGLDLGYAAPLLDGIFDRFGGGLDGKVRVGGTLDNLRIGSEGMQLVDGVLGIDFTQVAYHVAGPISVDTEGLHFNGVTLSDGIDGKGSVSGSLLFGGFKNLKMDTHVQFDRTKVLGITADRPSPIFGTVYGSGRVDITGPFNSLVLNVDARTVKDGDLHIPLKSTGAKATGDLLVFKEPFVQVEEDPYELMMSTGAVKTQSKGDLDIRVKVRATPAVTAHIDIGEGNSLRGMGNGLIDLRIREAQNLFTINGDYTLNQGDFRFSALNLVSREFTIQDGSSIRFNGDVMDSDLNVSGIYSTKASLSTLLSTSASAGNNSLSRRQVDCIIGITDKLRNPKITLDIDIPELDPGTEGQVESALNTEDKVMKQFLYLLIAGSFLPNEESGIITTGTSNMLYSNMTGIMAGQLNSIFEKLNIPLDLGLNYQQNASGNDLFDVALSTQLFNNRVIVNGTIGNRRLYGTTTEEVTGDLDIDIKLDKPGTVRLNLFSHSADQYTSYLDNSQRNGVGLAYQREFNSLGQFFRDLFKSRAEREERLPDETAARRVLQIDSVGRAHPLMKNE